MAALRELPVEAGPKGVKANLIAERLANEYTPERLRKVEESAGVVEPRRDAPKKGKHGAARAKSKKARSRTGSESDS